jgi:hypothetical protein
MAAGQWLGLVLILLPIGGLLYAYLRRGAKIKADASRKNEDWPRITLGGS